MSSLAAAGRAEQQAEASGGGYVVLLAGHVLDHFDMHPITGSCAFLVTEICAFCVQPCRPLLVAPLEPLLSPNLRVGFPHADRAG